MKLKRIEGRHGKYFLAFMVVGVILSSVCVKEQMPVRLSAWIFLYTLVNLVGFVVSK